LAKNIDNFAKADGGVIREYLIRTAICADQFWFKDVSGRWKLHKMHPVADKVKDLEGTMVVPDDFNYWRKRVINLCTYEMTRQNFGLSFIDLMHLDVATFEEIEHEVYEAAKSTKERYDKLNNEVANKGANILEGMK
jgi:hypothetical protein